MVTRREDYLASPQIPTPRQVKANRLWMEIFANTNLLFGLELVALVLTIADPDLPISDSCITCDVDNANALCALARSGSKRPVIAAIPRIFWALRAIRDIAPWLEWVGLDFNVAGFSDPECFATPSDAIERPPYFRGQAFGNCDRGFTPNILTDSSPQWN